MLAALHRLAEMLGTSVSRMAGDMRWQEFDGWMTHFDRNPPGLEDDRRAAVIAMSMGSKWADIKKMFPALVPDTKFKEPHKQVILAGVAPGIAGGLAKLMAGAEGG